ncbi:GH25 family lysozyme [Eubacterium barkeri]|uniref:Putative peptidoglycan binding domain-containing protein n=1 Tax=Eubacterium barkeri TaxID=1528 RepID=A0A1H3HBB0_EUBBA|nr:GH25 family lysozyme [Eubacterium barkeri]SDY12883.1 Putative peptidoglycan binding domain-containing protein [Eubacterium barkeri]
MSLNGIDISAYQRGINLDAVPADFVIIKATEGTDYVNDDCDRAYQEAKSTGKRLGVYHFADGNSSGTAEADYFVDNVQGYIGHAILILDWETNAVNCGPGYAKEFLDRVQARTGVKPLIYMSGSVTNEYDWSDVVAGDYGLWVAYYSVDSVNGYVPDAPMYPIGHWSDAAILQYTSGGQISGWGGNLDLNVFYGNADAWAKYVGGGPTVTNPEPAQGSDVPWDLINIQYWMVICGYNPAAPIDGIDGVQTTNGVKCGQRAYGIPDDGLFGLITQASAKDEVLAYQTRLKKLGYYTGELDGIPGPATFAAVKTFQRDHGLVADGIVGMATQAALGL